MKDHQPEAVLEALAPFLEREKPARGEAAVQACYRYIRNRPGPFDYRSVLDAAFRWARPKSKAATAMGSRTG
jgi:hypothetical protein